MEFSNSKIKVRYMKEDDIEEVYKINVNSFSSDAWSLDSIKREFSLPYSYRYVLEYEEKIVGYAFVWVIKEEAFIMAFAIDKNYRNKGLGKFFLREIIDDLKGKVRVFQLDVRKSNLRAIRLYRSLGFKVIKERPKFYSDGENALVMEKELNARV